MSWKEFAAATDFLPGGHSKSYFVSYWKIERKASIF